MRLMTIAAASLALALSSPDSADADVITFENLNVLSITTPITEGAFTYQVVTGLSWRVRNIIGNPPSALSTGSSAPNVGDEVEFFLTGGGLFAFTSFDFTAFSVGGSDGVNFFGEVGGVVTEQLLGIGSTSTSWQTSATGFSAPIDRLRVVVSSGGQSDLELDNLIVTPVASAVPEPSTWALGVMGALGCGAIARRRKALKVA